MNNSEVVRRQKLFPALTKALGSSIRSYLDAEMGVGTYQWLWGDDDAALDDESGKKIILRFPCVILVNPEVQNYRLVQDLEPVIKDIDREKLTAKEFRPAKPVKLVYELRVLTNNPDNDESFMTALERASEELFSVYPMITDAPDVGYKVNIWWGEGLKYSYDVETTTRVYKITATAYVESRKFRTVKLIDPANPVAITTTELASQLWNQEFSLQFETKVRDSVVYINEEFRGLPSEGTLEFDDWSQETVQFTARRLNKLTLSEPVKHFHLQGTTLRIGV